MTTNANDTVVAVYGTHEAADAALRELQRAGVNMQTLSIIARDTHTEEHAVGYYNLGDRMKYWGKAGAIWGGFWGMLFGSAFFAIPGIGPLLVAGPVIGWIIAGLEQAVVVGGLSALGAGLVGMGIPKDSVVEYEVALKTDKFLLMMNGTPAEVKTAKAVFDRMLPVVATIHGQEAVLTGAR